MLSEYVDQYVVTNQIAIGRRCGSTDFLGHPDCAWTGPTFSALAERMTRQALHFLWAIPVAVGMWLILWIAADFEWCGIGSCRAPERDLYHQLIPTVILVVLGGIVVALPFVLIRWTSQKGTRVATGSAAFVMASAAGWLFLYLAGWR